ncbi:MAG: DUF6979 family protein [Shewanella sp.]
MNKTVYGLAAVEAAGLVSFGTKPREAWNMAVKDLSASARAKGCPRSAFIGLCDMGYVRKSKPIVFDVDELGKNARYAIEAVRILKNSSFNYKADKLWHTVIQESDNPEKQHNGQMHVVMALMDARLIDFTRV